MAVAEHHHVKKKRDPETHYFATELDGPPVREVTAPKSTDDDDDGGGGGGGEAASQSSSRAAAPSPAPDAATDDLLGESSGSSKPASPAVSAVPFTGTGAEAATPSPLPPAAAPSTHIARLQAANRKIESQLASLRNVLARIDEKPGGSPRKPRPQGYSSADPASSLEAVAKQTARYKRENEVLSERLKSPTEGGGLSDLHHLVAARDEEARNLRIRLKRLQAGLKRVEKTLASASEGSLEGTVDKAKVGAKAVEDVLRQRLARVKESRQREQQVVQQQTAVLATLRTAISTEKYPSVDVKGLKDLERDLEERAKQIAAANAQLVIVRRSKESEKDRLRWCIRDKREEERMLGAQLSRIEHTLQSKQDAVSANRRFRGDYKYGPQSVAGRLEPIGASAASPSATSPAKQKGTEADTPSGKRSRGGYTSPPPVNGSTEPQPRPPAEPKEDAARPVVRRVPNSSRGLAHDDNNDDDDDDCDGGRSISGGSSGSSPSHPPEQHRQQQQEEGDEEEQEEAAADPEPPRRRPPGASSADGTDDDDTQPASTPPPGGPTATGAPPADEDAADADADADPETDASRDGTGQARGGGTAGETAGASASSSGGGSERCAEAVGEAPADGTSDPPAAQGAEAGGGVREDSEQLLLDTARSDSRTCPQAASPEASQNDAPGAGQQHGHDCNGGEADDANHSAAGVGAPLGAQADEPASETSAGEAPATTAVHAGPNDDEGYGSPGDGSHNDGSPEDGSPNDGSPDDGSPDDGATTGLPNAAGACRPNSAEQQQAGDAGSSDPPGTGQAAGTADAEHPAGSDGVGNRASELQEPERDAEGGSGKDTQTATGADGREAGQQAVLKEEEEGN